jgi:hypothetical protein
MIDLLTIVQELADFDGEADCIVAFVFGPDDSRWLSLGTQEGVDHAVQSIPSAVENFRQRFLQEDGPDQPSTPGAQIDAERMTQVVIQNLKGTRP